MAVFIEARTDPFVERREQLTQDIRQNGRNSVAVRRPLRGIELKKDTYAVIRIALDSGGFMPVLDAAGEVVTSSDGKTYTTQYTNFLLQSVIEQREEKQQIVETFGDAYIFFYGESPRMLQVSGLLLNTADFGWAAEWWDNYERYMRGTRLVENGARLYLIYDDVIVEGYVLQCQAQRQVQQPYTIPFSFQLFVTGYSSLALVGDPNYPVPDGVDPEGIVTYEDEVTSDTNTNRQNWIEGLRRAGRVRAIQSTISSITAGYLGEGRLLAQAIKSGIEDKDPSVLGFMRRSRGAITGFQRASIGAAMQTQAAREAGLLGRNSDELRSLPNSLREPRDIRGTFRDNTDEFIGLGEQATAEELAQPLSMNERWSQLDTSFDAFASDFINPTDMRFGDLMGRPGRTDPEVAMRQGPFRRADGIFQAGSTRQLRPGIPRSTPFGIAAFAEDPPPPELPELPDLPELP